MSEQTVVTARMPFIRSAHTEVSDGTCGLCDVVWPCDTGTALMALAAAEQARDEALEQLAAAESRATWAENHTATVERSYERLQRDHGLNADAAIAYREERDALAERVRDLEAALAEIRDSITGALLPNAGLTHNAAPNSIPIQTYLISAHGVKTLVAALAASSQPEAGAAVCRCRHRLSDHGDGGCLFEHGIGAICSCLTFEAGAAVEAEA